MPKLERCPKLKQNKTIHFLFPNRNESFPSEKYFSIRKLAIRKGPLKGIIYFPVKLIGLRLHSVFCSCSAYHKAGMH